MKKILIVLILVGGALFFGSERLLTYVLTPKGMSGYMPDDNVFEVPRGSSLSKVAARLEQKNLVTNARLFKLYAYLRGADKSIKMGEYLLTPGSPPSELIAILSSGKSIQYSVTIPEGANIFEVAKRLSQDGRYKYEDILKACRDQNLIRQFLDVQLSSLEGYLFPETYKYTKYTTINEVLREMTKRFKENYAAISSRFPTKMTRHEVVTLASVIEKETGAPEERPLISSVFHNRLNKGMRLQSDPTIIYGMWVETGVEPKNISKNDIRRATPYNTYTVARLPQGPIANPGREALEATLNPGVSDFLYFVSRNDGTHIFSNTYEAHNKAVRSFQMNPKARQGKSWRDLKNRPAAAN